FSQALTRTLCRHQLAGQLREMVHPVALGFGGGVLQRLARLRGVRLSQEAPAQVLAPRGIEWAPERLPGLAGLLERGARLPGVGGRSSASLQARRLADRVAQAVGEALGLLRRFA